MNNQIKISLILIIALVGFPQISETIYTPSMPDVVQGLKASVHAVEGTLAIYFVGFAIGVSIWGLISDFLGRRSVMLIGLGIYTVSCLGCAYAENVEMLILWRGLQALGAGVGSVITQTMLRDLYDGQTRAKLFSIISASLAFSPAIGPLLGGSISEFWGWQTNFTLLVFAGLFMSIWCLFRLPETKPEHLTRLGWNQMRELFYRMITSKTLWGHTLLIGTTNGILFSFYEEGPFIFIDYLGMQPTQYGLLGILIAVSTLISARISYVLSQTFSPQKMIMGGAAITLGGGVCFALTVFFGFFMLNAWLLLTILSLFIIFTGIGLIIPNSLSIALKPFQEAAGTAGSLFGGAYYILIAGYTWGMSLLHTGDPLVLPFYMLAMGAILILGSTLVKEGRYSLDKLLQSLKTLFRNLRGSLNPDDR